MKGEKGDNLKLESIAEKRVLTDDEIYSKLVEKLVNIDDYPHRRQYSLIFFKEKSESWLYRKLGADGVARAEKEALDIKRTQMAGVSAKVDQVLIELALEGDLKAIKLYYERLENWSVNSKIEVKTDDSLADMLKGVFNQSNSYDGYANTY